MRNCLKKCIMKFVFLLKVIVMPKVIHKYVCYMFLIKQLLSRALQAIDECGQKCLNVYYGSGGIWRLSLPIPDPFRTTTPHSEPFGAFGT